MTLVGPGGVGKTRLAVEVARALQDRGGPPVSFVELAALSADQIGPTVSRTLGVADGADPVAALRRQLADRCDLVVLDNCEHAVEATAELVDAVVPFCPGFRVLATSRTRLGVPGEQVWPVPPLPAPDPGDVERLADLDGYGATRMFLERAATAGAEMHDSAETARSVARICAAVDGLPLGIELAAALTRELPLDRIGDGLAPRLGATPGGVGRRHGSLDAVIGWSYELLDPTAQRLVRRLAVFEGGFTIVAAEAVCAGDDFDVASVPAVTAGLVAVSLVTFQPTTGRYSMLETVHAFARARLADTGETERFRDAHLGWCRQLAAAAAPGLVGPGAGDSVRLLNADYPNLQAALQWALTDDRHLDAAAALAHDLLEFWETIDSGRDATGLLGAILDRPGPLTVERVELSLAAGDLLSDMGDFRSAASERKRALTLARSLNNPQLLGHCLVKAAYIPNTEDTDALLTEAAAIAQRLDDRDLSMRVYSVLGMVALRAGRYEEAAACCEYRIVAETDSRQEVRARDLLASIHQAQGAWQAAREQLLIIERVAAASEDRLQAAIACSRLAQIELADHDVEGARRDYERARVWGRPHDDYWAEQLAFDAVGALLQAESGDIATAANIARGLATLPGDITDDAGVCDGWLMTGEVLARARDLPRARGCFGHILRHRAGAFPINRANALAAMAGTLIETGPRAVADQLAAAATAIRARHALVTPPWLTVAAAELVTLDTAGGPASSPGLDDEAVALALTLDS